MPLPNILKKKDIADKSKLTEDHIRTPFLFLHTDSLTQEISQPPASPSTNKPSTLKDITDSNKKKIKHFWGKLRPVVVDSSLPLNLTTPSKPKFRRLSLGLRKTQVSEKVPIDLPNIEILAERVEKGVEEKVNEIKFQWEKRATILAKTNEESWQNLKKSNEGSATNLLSKDMIDIRGLGLNKAPMSIDRSGDDIQEAIRLHETGELETSTLMFGRIAKSLGENNLLSQVLYGLSLRHGWGCTPNPVEAVKYLSIAASNAAAIEEMALQAGKKVVGTARGELVLAIYELANCFRHGWGVPVDKLAAKQYYETAANLGDTDAMNETARCYLEGFGCTKDKLIAARYYRMAERKGNKILGNSWIWKEKYDV